MKEKLESIGRRKEAVAHVKILTGNGKININGKTFEEYIQNNPKIIKIIQSPLLLLELEKNYDITIKSRGGGLIGQAEAIKLGITKALCKIIENTNKQKLKINGFLTRNSLSKERKKFGLKKARKASQFSKR